MPPFHILKMYKNDAVYKYIYGTTLVGYIRPGIRTKAHRTKAHEDISPQAFDLPLWAYVVVGFCPMGFCPMGFCPTLIRPTGLLLCWRFDNLVLAAGHIIEFEHLDIYLKIWNAEKRVFVDDPYVVAGETKTA